MALSRRGPYAGRRVLVTGASGFIGRHVARAAAQAGAVVVTVTRGGVTAPPPAGTRAIIADLSEAGSAERIVRDVRPTVTFNLAGYGVDPGERDESAADRINHALVGELAAACGTVRDPTWSGVQLIHAGSALEYGTATGDLDEETRPTPSTLYGISKLAGTNALHHARERGEVRAVTARLFTVFGPGEYPGRLLPTLIAAIRNGVPIPLTAGTQRRDFTYVADVAEAMIRLATLVDPRHDVVNVATGVLTRVRDFTERAADVMGLPRELLRFGEVPTRAEEMAHDDVSTARLVEMCGWKPGTTIEDGVRATVEAARGEDH